MESYQAVITTLPMMESSIPCSVPAHITGKYTNSTNVIFPISQLGIFRPITCQAVKRNKCFLNISNSAQNYMSKREKLKQISPNIPDSVQLHVHAVKRNKSFPISPYSVQYMSQISKTETKEYSHPGNFHPNIFNNIAVNIFPKTAKI